MRPRASDPHPRRVACPRRMARPRALALTVTLAALTSEAPRAHAEPPALAPKAEPAAPASDETKQKARELYAEGVALVKKFQWSEALVRFEASSKLYPNPVTTLNMGACQRALGRYVEARGTLRRALDEHQRAGGAAIPESSVAEAKAFLDEIERLLARATITIEPREAALAVDGRPLVEVARTPEGRPVLAAGLAAPGVGAVPPAATFDLVLDPGAHVLTLSRKGFTDAVVNKTFAPGSSATLTLKLDLLPATLRITASQKGAIVRVGGDDVGPAPVDVLRPAGVHQVLVKKPGFVPYRTQVTVRAGEEAKLDAVLAVDKPSLASRWWVWTGVAVLVAGGVTVTYLVTRPTPQPPPYDGGTTGWVVEPTGFRF